MNQLPEKFSILTDQNPRYARTVRSDLTLADLLAKEGLSFVVVVGNYAGDYERSYLVPNIKQILAEKLGEIFGQESVIHHDKGLNTLVYVNGPRNYQWETGRGIVTHGETGVLTENYTELPNGFRFQLSLNFGAK